MLSLDTLQVEDDSKVWKSIRHIKFIIPILGIGILLAAVIFILSIITLVKVNKKIDAIQNYKQRSMINFKEQQHSSDTILASSIRIEEAMSHLNELQRIATVSNGTRAINTLGFNDTLDYIRNYLTANTNFKVQQSFFPLMNFALAQHPILISSVDDVMRNYTYASNISDADFYHAKYSTSINTSEFTPLAAIPNYGCFDHDWRKANPSTAGRVALVKRGFCSFDSKVDLAKKYSLKAVLLYNDGVTEDRHQPIGIRLSQENTMPVLFLSSTVGEALVSAAQSASRNASVRLIINVKDLLPIPIGNICADTPTGDSTQTIIIGSHSDSVLEGPGINDNGSGSAANLALAVALARLFRTPSYPKYRYRVRFCWWGAEEIGLLGSDHHVKQAKNSSIVGERLSDYLINLNYDMLASPNYIFGIYDAHTAKNGTPVHALPGSQKITSLFKNWFIQQNLPWDYTSFTDLSDYGPFLAEGIVAGGLYSGADEKKTMEQRNRYDATLGQGLGGIPDIMQDPCYHRACDSIENINVYAYEKMIRAAAYALEYLGRQEDLKAWLYPLDKKQ